ncbi:tRNA-dihydrouridine(20a/20b) synthase [NAD(P)+]-like protein [Emericellopsis cladophorae]|uniref:tRNA-dihydrouridine synthase n=1 Tax=Emericellopsis cladophorae TaxID=2686198 RepID=A0A9P9Y9I5_9HYPO|nr:tRNA-dihydrouridine(20a/20b) synthase [NAD(P)+]-like protein [Emericellopsis cladophorae]KAI6785883.1 tRNA-dihydrouridine(20a/20b) synthase [NAD(P)+]-like protein [Emericellopsis cladophorae]
MVRYSKLAFRQTVHHYGTDLSWTPMILAKEFNRSSFARDGDLTINTAGPQPPTILQFGANNPRELARASLLAIPWVNGVDLNCGCPQSWACAETLGAALMNQRELVRDMVLETRSTLADGGWHVGIDKDKESATGRSVSVKIRIHDDLRRTMDWVDAVIGDPNNRNVDWITIHPRTRSTPSTTPIREDALAILAEKYSPILPVLLSGDVFDARALPFQASTPATHDTLTLNDILPRDKTGGPKPSNTNIAGFMSARGLLSNPALFGGHATCPWEAVEYFMNRVARAPIPFKLTLHHVHEMVSPGMGKDKTALLDRKERAQLNRLTNMFDLVDFLDAKIEEKTGQKGIHRDL